MNTTLLSPVPETAVRPTVDTALSARTARTSWPDRVALRIGLWLLLWSTRPSPPRSPAPDAAVALANAHARRERESAWLTQRRFTHPL